MVFNSILHNAINLKSKFSSLFIILQVLSILIYNITVLLSDAFIQPLFTEHLQWTRPQRNSCEQNRPKPLPWSVLPIFLYSVVFMYISNISPPLTSSPWLFSMAHCLVLGPCLAHIFPAGHLGDLCVPAVGTGHTARWALVDVASVSVGPWLEPGLMVRWLGSSPFSAVQCGVILVRSSASVSWGFPICPCGSDDASTALGEALRWRGAERGMLLSCRRGPLRTHS